MKDLSDEGIASRVTKLILNSMTGISDNETKAVLELRSQMSSDPIVFDVGSNKGGWADILIKNVKEMHLFEPNERLLTYTMVKYDYLKNVVYNPVAVSDKEGEALFTVFYNENNGLSNIIQNPKWNYLPGELDKVDTISLDEYWRLNFWDQGTTIDFVKIDVEGAEMLVLKGAKNLLGSKRIKFVQIEYSEHYQVTGITFKDIIKYLESFGYKGYAYDNGFSAIDSETFVEDGRLENFWFMVEFTQDWNSEFKKNTQGIKVETALEIGCFEGLTTNYICDNLLTENGRVICIDPLTDEYLPGHKDNAMFVGQYDRFIRNTAGRPVQLIRQKSLDAFPGLKDLRFGLIYIDGDHTEQGVFQDAVLYWNLLLDSPRNAGGYMLFDDYGQSAETAKGIDRFLETQKGNYDLLIKDYQVLIRRRW
jgi:FkbM family methyltransferase